MYGYSKNICFALYVRTCFTAAVVESPRVLQRHTDDSSKCSTHKFTIKPKY